MNIPQTTQVTGSMLRDDFIVDVFNILNALEGISSFQPAHKDHLVLTNPSVKTVLYLYCVVLPYNVSFMSVNRQICSVRGS